MCAAGGHLGRAAIATQSWNKATTLSRHSHGKDLVSSQPKFSLALVSSYIDLLLFPSLCYGNVYSPLLQI